jgi:hypothetical protein
MLMFKLIVDARRSTEQRRNQAVSCKFGKRCLGTTCKAELLAGRSNEAIGEKVVRKSNFALRLQPSLLDEACKLAEAEGVALNQLINVAVAEKVSALRTESYA